MPNISHEEAIKQIRDKQAKNISIGAIRLQMLVYGFRFADINEMIDPKQSSDDVPKRKRKNNFHSKTFVRGAWLSVYLIIQAIALVGSNFVLFMNWQNDFDGEYGKLFLFTFIIIAVISSIILICILGLWNGKRFGYHGLLLLMTIIVGLGMLTATAPLIIVGIVGIFILYELVKSKVHLLS